MRDRQEDWSDITLSDALSILAAHVNSLGLGAVVRIALDRDGILLYLPTTTIEQPAIGLNAAVSVTLAVAA